MPTPIISILFFKILLHQWYWCPQIHRTLNVAILLYIRRIHSMSNNCLIHIWAIVKGYIIITNCKLPCCECCGCDECCNSVSINIMNFQDRPSLFPLQLVINWLLVKPVGNKSTMKYIDNCKLICRSHPGIQCWSLLYSYRLRITWIFGVTSWMCVIITI